MTDRPSITDALGMWSTWHADISPLGSTGDYALDMLLADAFRALLYRPAINDRLSWLEREARRARRVGIDPLYHTHLARWHAAIFEAEKMPVIELRSIERRALCASL